MFLPYLNFNNSSSKIAFRSFLFNMIFIIFTVVNISCVADQELEFSNVSESQVDKEDVYMRLATLSFSFALAFIGGLLFGFIGEYGRSQCKLNGKYSTLAKKVFNELRYKFISAADISDFITAIEQLEQAIIHTLDIIMSTEIAAIIAPAIAREMQKLDQNLSGEEHYCHRKIFSQTEIAFIIAGIYPDMLTIINPKPVGDNDCYKAYIRPFPSSSLSYRQINSYLKDLCRFSELVDEEYEYWRYGSLKLTSNNQGKIRECVNLELSRSQNNNLQVESKTNRNENSRAPFYRWRSFVLFILYNPLHAQMIQSMHVKNPDAYERCFFATSIEANEYETSRIKYFNLVLDNSDEFDIVLKKFYFSLLEQNSDSITSVLLSICCITDLEIPKVVIESLCTKIIDKHIEIKKLLPRGSVIDFRELTLFDVNKRCCWQDICC